MKELSLNILDIVENSVKAGATLTQIEIIEYDNILKLIISDNGCGMTDVQLKNVTNPFFTTRTTRKVGMGLPFLKLEAEMTGGNVQIQSKAIKEYPIAHGTIVTALFYKDHIDFTPLGDVISSIKTIIQGHPDSDFYYIHKYNNKTVSLDTREIKKILDGVDINNFEVIKWIDDYLTEQYNQT